jgi:cytochrome P450
MRLVAEHYGPGPVLLRTPGRNVALVLSAEHLRRVLDGSPEPFAVANREKRAALSHFQPGGVLVSQGGQRATRRSFNEDVLDSARPAHRLAREFEEKVQEEAAAMLGTSRRFFAWDDFAVGWWRVVRRVVLGDAARDDHELTDLLLRLRKDANWAYLKPKRTRLRECFRRRLDDHLSRAEPGSLAALVASSPAGPGTEPAEQVPQWLFAFDAAGMASFRALALLDTHSGERHDPAFLRASVLESVRLWPTTPAILRDTTAETRWESGTLPMGTAVLIFVPYFHRDPRRLSMPTLSPPRRGSPRMPWLIGRSCRSAPDRPSARDATWCCSRPALCSRRYLSGIACGRPTSGRSWPASRCRGPSVLSASATT